MTDLRRLPDRVRLGYLVPVILVLLAACSPPPAQPTPTILPSFTPSPGPPNTATPTPTPLPTVTRTLEPTLTSTLAPSVTPTLSPTPPKTITPAAPLTFDEFFSLRDWTPGGASQAIELLLAEPDATYKDYRGPEYYQHYRFAAIGMAEGVLRFPGTFPEALWRWDLAYTLALSGDPQAAELYSEIIITALNETRVAPEELNQWFSSIEPRASLRSFPLEPLPGYDSTSLLVVNAGGSAFLLLNESQGSYISTVLWANFDFSKPGSYDFSHADYTGDGFDDLVIYQQTAAGNLEPPLPAIFDLSGPVPDRLPFEPGAIIPVGIEHEGLWRPVNNAQGSFDLEYSTIVFPLCPVEITQSYRWTGEYFTLVETSHQLQPDPLLLENCDLILDHAVANWGTTTALALMEPDLAKAASADTSFTLSPELMDKWLLRLGLYHALNGDFETAQRYLTTLRDSPNSAEAGWSQEAAGFLQMYGTSIDIYPACQTTDFCPPMEAVRLLAESAPSNQFDEIVGWLGQRGVPVRSSGDFDFEGDGRPERWFAVRPEGRNDIDLWMIASNGVGIDIVFIGVIDTSQPTINVLDADSPRPVIQIGGLPPFTIERHPVTGSAYIARFTNFGLFATERVALVVSTAQFDLLSGIPPEEIIGRLTELQNSPTFICIYSDCPDFLYTLALAHELAGNEREAVALYLELWRGYPSIPYTILARLKLDGLAGPTPRPATLTPTVTGTPTISPTPDPNATPTPTPTVTHTPTLTSSPSATP